MCLSTELNLKDDQPPFDMVVSELIGTMLHSESMSIYLWDLVKRGVVQAFPSPSELSRPASAEAAPAPLVRYMVPQSGQMTARVYRCPHAVGLVSGFPFAPMESIYEAIYDCSRASARAPWNSDESMHFCLASGPWSAISEAFPVLREFYDQPQSSIHYQQEVVFRLPPDVPKDAVVVLEWTVQLSANQTLRHTLDHVASLPSQVRLARWMNWGFTFAPLHHFVDDTSLASGACMLSVAWHPADIEFIARKPGFVYPKAISDCEGGWAIVSSKRLNKVLAAINRMVARGESSV